MATEDYEGSAVGWRRSYANQGLSTQEARSGAYSWRVESSSGCDGGCQYMTNKSFQADQLDLSGISGLEVLNPVTRNVGDRAIAAYWDDLQLAVEQGPASGYDVQVARGAT